MKGDAAVIKALNNVLTKELTAINQYFLHSRMLDDKGYKKLGQIVYKESIYEMKNAQERIDRILFLEGIPNVQKLDAISIGETPKEMLEADLALEHVAIPTLKEGIKACFEAVDHASRDLFERILIDEEKHVDWIETQLSAINDLGEKAYLAEQLDSSN